MSSTKRYFWLKLKDDFFTSREIKKLRRIAGGDTYTIIYLKMQLLSIKKEGLLVYEGTEADIVEQLSLELDEDMDNVSVTLSFLQANKLIEQLSENEFLLNKVPECIGSETTAAERMRKMRAKRNDVTPQLQTVTNSYTEKEREIESEREIETHTERDARARARKPELDSFDEFWKKYPNKIMQEQAASLWLSIDPDEKMIEEIMEGLGRWLASDQWDRGIYQSPVNWLRDERWKDQPPKCKPKKGQAGSHHYQDEEIQDLIAQKMAKQRAVKT